MTEFELSENKRNSKYDICFALFLLAKKKGYSEISVGDISTKAGVSRMTFYRHFTCKEDVFSFYADEVFADFINMIEKTKRGSVEDFLVALFSFLANYKESLRILIETKRYCIMLDKYEQYINYLYRRISFQDSKYKILDINTQSHLFPVDKYTVSFISGGIYNAVYKWVKNNYNDEPEEVAHQLSEVLNDFSIREKTNTK